MKAILEFNLPDEKSEYHDAMNGSSYIFTIQELDEYLRRRLKYDNPSDTEEKILQEVRDQLCNLRKSRNAYSLEEA